jgi:transcriptional regulator with XRE-family HTH domain
VIAARSGRGAFNAQRREEMRRICARLTEWGWSSRELAAMMGVSQSTIRSWEAGKTMGANDQRESLQDLPRRFGDRVDALIRSRLLAVRDLVEKHRRELVASVTEINQAYHRRQVTLAEARARELSLMAGVK